MNNVHTIQYEMNHNQYICGSLSAPDIADKFLVSRLG